MIDGQRNPRHLAVGAGKDSNLYLVDLSNMGKFNPANDNAVYQELDGVLSGGVWAMPAYFHGVLYYGAVGNHLKAFPFVNARLTNSTSQTTVAFGYLGTTPSISANGASPAGDGVPNLIKYALGLNPTNAAAAAQLPSGRIQSSGGTNYLTLTVNRAAQPPDVTDIVEVSSNLLSGWVSGPPNTVTLTNLATQLVVQDTAPVPAATARFIRLRVINP